MIVRHWLATALFATPVLAIASRSASSERLVIRHEHHDEEVHETANASERVATRPHAHDHNSPPAAFFNVSDFPPDPLSYFVQDTTASGHGGLMAAHILLMTSAWFGWLPLALVLWTAKHPLYHLAQLAFVTTTILGMVIARLYEAQTLNLYEHNKHSTFGWLAAALAAALFAVDMVRLGRGLKNWISDGARLRMLGNVLAYTSKGNQDSYELLASGIEEHDAAEPADEQPHSPSASEGSSRDSNDTLHDNERHVRWSSTPSPSRSDFDLAKHKHPFLSTASPGSRVRKFLKYFHIFLLRLLPVLGYASFILGIVVYSGKCRSTYLNGCLAHLIKGSIFLLWGLLSLGRYLGAWAELGWAWNRKPETATWRRHAPTAEAVECFVITLYGCTNVFMERFGAHKGDPFSIHEIQHISIAILFAGVGLMGLAIESKAIRTALAQATRYTLWKDQTGDIHAPDPHSYSASFNPVPALVAAATGLAMSAHHQPYVFAVQVHQLWGYLLMAFGLARISTYAFLWLRPPASVLPSRPPTEALAAFFCASGGIVFMLSTEQVVFAAMANDLADVMTFNNLALALTGVLFAWATALMAIKGWATVRMANLRSAQVAQRSCYGDRVGV